MSLSPGLIDAALAAFRARLIAAADTMQSARNARSFCDAERVVHDLTLELAAEITQRALQEVSDDQERRAEALATVRAKAESRGIKMRQERARKTMVRTLGGQVVEVVTPYATARPRGGGRLETRGRQGTGV